MAPHPQPIDAVAISRDGTQLATGSECDYDTGDAEEAVVGVVLWDVARGAVRARVPVEGGIGLGDQLRRGLAFSADGRHLAFNHFTNAVGVLETSTGRVVVSAHASYADGAPSFVLDDAASRLIVAASDGGPPAWATIFSVASGGPIRPIPSDERRPFEAIAIADGTLHGLSHGALLAIDAATGAVLERLTLFEGARNVFAWPSPTARRVAATLRDGAGIVLVDTRTHEVLCRDPGPTDVSAFVFDRSERRWAAVRAERRAGSRTSGVTVYDDDRPLGTIAGPLHAMDWQSLGDGVPFALSPDGSQAALVRPTGEVERHALGARVGPGERLTRIADASAVLWGAGDVLVVYGREVIAFVRADDGALIAEHRLS